MHRKKMPYFRAGIIAMALLCCFRPAAAQEAPALPSGLDRRTAPPALPEGLGETPADNSAQETSGPALSLPFSLTGFLDVRGGTRLQSDRYEKTESLGETRLQSEVSFRLKKVGVKLTGDLIYDPVLDRPALRLGRGEGWFDLREAHLFFTLFRFMDIKAGRQIMTWGTGDLLFINDLFPKDWNSFFIGRDVEYLKAPCDALRISLYFDLANIDLYFAPEFDPDRYLDGRQLSYWNTGESRRAGRDRVIRPRRPSGWFDDWEGGCRIFKNIGGYELAGYAYAGFWKSPAGSGKNTGKPMFPDLRVYGASFRGRFFNGIGTIEFGYYDSGEDRHGDDPLVRNSEMRLLIGYERELRRDFTAGLQYYLEHMRRHNHYRKTLPAGAYPRDRNRQVVTLRLTQLLYSQNLTLGLFLYWSPSDSDLYARPNIQYKISDDLAVEAGGNIFSGRHDHTFFGQFEKNTNLYVSVRKYFSLP